MSAKHNPSKNSQHAQPNTCFSGDWVDLVQAAAREGARSVAWNDAKGETRSFCVF